MVKRMYLKQDNIEVAIALSLRIYKVVEDGVQHET